MAKTPGAVWVDGTDFHWVDPSGVEWSVTGTVVSSTAPSGFSPGDFQVSTTNNRLVYVDGNKAVRSIDAVTKIGPAPAGAQIGELQLSNSSNGNNNGHGSLYFVANDNNVYGVWLNYDTTTQSSTTSYYYYTYSTPGTEYSTYTAGTQYSTYTPGTQYSTYTPGSKYSTYSAGSKYSYTYVSSYGKYYISDGNYPPSYSTAYTKSYSTAYAYYAGTTSYAYYAGTTSYAYYAGTTSYAYYAATTSYAYYATTYNYARGSTTSYYYYTTHTDSPTNLGS